MTPTNQLRFLLLKLVATLAALVAGGCQPNWNIAPQPQPVTPAKPAEPQTINLKITVDGEGKIAVAGGAEVKVKHEITASPIGTPSASVRDCGCGRGDCTCPRRGNTGNVTPSTAATKRKLHFFGPTWCPLCPAALQQVKASLGGEFVIVEHHDDAAFPAWIVTQASRPNWGYPMVWWPDAGGNGKVMVWSGEAAFRAADGQPRSVSTSAEAASAATPMDEVNRVLGLLPHPQVGFVDFGCGDGRWVIAAAQRWDCRATGIEIDPARAAAARERVQAAGLSHLVTIITGDATATDVQADVGVAYLWQDVLQQLLPRLQRLRAFASYQHQPPGLNVVRNGDSWIYTAQSSIQPVSQQQSRGAMWGGQVYSGPVCNSPGCPMCRSIRSQLRM